MITQSQLAQLQSSVYSLQVATARLAAAQSGQRPASQRQYYYPRSTTAQAAARHSPAASARTGARLVQKPQVATRYRPASTNTNVFGTVHGAARNVVSGAGTAARSVGSTVGTTVSGAASRARSVWTSHISQFRNQYNPNGPSMAPNCGPASVTMALRMVGLDIPGFKGQRDQRVLDKARIIATGKNDTRVGTTDTELERVIKASGGKFSESSNFSTLTSWIKKGVPVIMAGNPAYAWNKRISGNQVYPFNGGHWVTVSGYDSSKRQYIVNDPLSAIGPIYVPESELASYFSKGGLGIGVYR